MGCCSDDHCHKQRHHGHQSKSCCGGSSSCCCCCCSEQAYESEESEECKGTKLLELADVAWMELLKEKIKEHIRATDTKMDELAKIVAEANHKRWKHKMEKDKCCEDYDLCCDDYHDQLCRLFSSCDSGSCHTDSKGNNQKK